MAYNVSTILKYSSGPERVNVLSITADAATQAVSTGLRRITNFSVGLQSCTTGSLKIYANKDASGTSSNGTLGISGVANGDVFYVRVYGN